MRSKIWILLLCVHCLAFAASAQQSPAKRQLVLQLSNGGFVGFRSETSAPESTTLPNVNAVASLLYSRAFAGENRIIHRVLTDAQQNVVFGYDLLITADPVTKKFSVAVLPADEAFRLSFLKDFTLDAIALAVKNYSLSINGTVVNKSKSSFGASGALLWFYVPDRGRVIFSLVPREGYQFEKIAVLNENKIEFTVNGERYEWVSGDPILPNGGFWYLWVLRDTKYTPLFPSETPQPRTALKKGPNVFDKLEGMLTNQGVVLTLGGSPLYSKSNPNTVVPQRVMIGGADSMENLLPKSP